MSITFFRLTFWSETSFLTIGEVLYLCMCSKPLSSINFQNILSSYPFSIFLNHIICSGKPADLHLVHSCIFFCGCDASALLYVDISKSFRIMLIMVENLEVRERECQVFQFIIITIFLYEKIFRITLCQF